MPTVWFAQSPSLTQMIMYWNQEEQIYCQTASLTTNLAYYESHHENATAD